VPYYHYTSRQFAQDIGCTGVLKPGLSGFVYLSPHAYTSGIVAADELSLIGKPIEIGIEIHMHVSSPQSFVGPLRDPSGGIIRKGGGTEVTVSNPIPIGNPVNWITLSEP
jgi:hypothetical protein